MTNRPDDADEPVSSAGQWTRKPDPDLVAAVVRPSQPADRDAAFTAIYMRHLAAVSALCAGLLADRAASEDAVAETFVTAWADLTAGKPPANPERLRAWLQGIARHRCMKELRQRDHSGPMPALEAEDDD